MPPTSDFTGQKFGYLTAINRVPHNSKHNHILWTFRCDCGKYKDIELNLVRIGRTKSCGCKQKELQNVHKLKSRPDSSLRSLFGEYRKNAVKRSHAFELSLEQFKEITSKDCHYCGCRPEQVYCRKDKQTVIPYIYNGIDRMDNSRGYVLDNVVPCCGICNTMKRTLNYDDFLSRIKSIYFRRVVK